MDIEKSLEIKGGRILQIYWRCARLFYKYYIDNSERMHSMENNRSWPKKMV